MERAECGNIGEKEKEPYPLEGGWEDCVGVLYMSP